jgi:hypothetical protein
MRNSLHPFDSSPFGVVAMLRTRPEEVDSAVRFAEEAGIRWTREDILWHQVQPERNAWRWECYRGQVHAWEIWNEPNSQTFWHPHPDPKEYVRLLIAGAETVKRADATAQLLSNACSPDYLTESFSSG